MSHSTKILKYQENHDADSTILYALNYILEEKQVDNLIPYKAKWTLTDGSHLYLLGDKFYSEEPERIKK